MTRPDVVGIWDALAELPDRTPAQRELDLFSAEMLRDSVEEETDDEAWADEAARWALEVLAEIKLSKTARAAAEEALRAYVA